MTLASLEVMQALSTDFLISLNSRLSFSTLHCLLLLARVPVRRSSADKPPGVLWFFPGVLETREATELFLGLQGQRRCSRRKKSGMILCVFGSYCFSFSIIIRRGTPLELGHR
ncbi:hypothetical protein V6N12_051563 [Hibiscus sabdariffa]|uniref:Secreted protein n=1 Tax=Hibiscus sabdariffa TaxID=183260 RepID=A0ABR2GGI1_9ROSI